MTYLAVAATAVAALFTAAMLLVMGRRDPAERSLRHLVGFRIDRVPRVAGQPRGLRVLALALP